MEFFTGSSAANIAVNPSLLTNPEKIAASGTGNSGDNSSALAIYRISQVKIMGNESYTVDEYYNAMTTEIASTTERSNNERDTASLLKEQSQNQREASKGVSIDEELLDMVKYQAAYGASAKLVETVNGLIETLIASV
jgi:flagellar hook-associated protein 1 FlgK